MSEPPMGLRLIQGGRASDGLPGLLIEHAAEVATMAGGLRLGVRMDDPALLVAPGGDPGHDAAPAVASWEGRILAAGPRNDLLQALEGSGYPLARFARLDAAGGTVTPGLIDPHTHLLFGGSREGELVLRQRGADYLEILQAGGGILSTVAATRAASDEELAEHGRRWLAEMLAHGTTTIEAKSGYGLDLPTELRLLEIAYQLGRGGPGRRPAHVARRPCGRRRSSGPGRTARRRTSGTCSRSSCPASRPRAGRASPTCSASAACSARSSRGACCWTAARLGLGSRLHADELAPSGGAELAAEIGALSADHLAVPSPDGIDALAAAAARRPRRSSRSCCRRRPGSSCTRTCAPARTFIDRGIPVALATDFNPGHLAHAEPAVRDDRGLPRAAAHPIGGARGDDDQRGGRARARRRGRLDRDRAAMRTSRSGASRRTGRSRTGRRRTSSAP